MTQDKIIQKTQVFVQQTLKEQEAAHDWWHIQRVWKLALHIAKEEQADTYIISLGALLHDIADWKFYNNDLTLGKTKAMEWLASLGIDTNIQKHIGEIIADISYKGAGVKTQMKTIEGKIVQDADRLDALGAIGIARTFAYGGYAKRDIYNPNYKPELHQTFDAYKNSKSSSINHFYEKLLLLKDMMNTPTAKQMAEKRHAFLEEYLDHFFKEWEGEA